MNIYDKPVVLNSIDLFEGVYAESGDLPDGPGMDVEVRWEGHNSGSHSEVQILVHENSGKTGEYFKVTLSFNGKGSIDSMVGPTNCSGWSRNGNTIEMWKDGHFNPGENFSMMITDIRFTESQYEGGVGSYYPSGDHVHEPAPEWSAFVTFS